MSEINLLEAAMTLSWPVQDTTSCSVEERSKVYQERLTCALRGIEDSSHCNVDVSPLATSSYLDLLRCVALKLQR